MEKDPNIMPINEYKIGVARIRIVKGDITDMTTGAIVNAANHSLMGGGGVDGAIHRKGGAKIKEECQKIKQTDYPNGLPTGKAVITSGGNLKSIHVIHTVGPVWRGGKFREDELLAEAYKNSLELAAANNLRSIAFPSISTGTYGYPIARACRIALNTVQDFLKNKDNLDLVVLVLYSDSDLALYEHLATEVFNACK